jgi:hypothetical protein
MWLILMLSAGHQIFWVLHIQRKIREGSGGVVQVVDCLLSKCEAPYYTHTHTHTHTHKRGKKDYIMDSIT